MSCVRGAGGGGVEGRAPMCVRIPEEGLVACETVLQDGPVMCERVRNQVGRRVSEGTEERSLLCVRQYRQRQVSCMRGY